MRPEWSSGAPGLLGPDKAEAGVAPPGPVRREVLPLELGEVVVWKIDRRDRDGVARALDDNVDGDAGLHERLVFLQVAGRARASGHAHGSPVGALQAVYPGAVEAGNVPLVLLGDRRVLP